MAESNSSIIPKFNLLTGSRDVSELATSWERWKRSMELYFVAESISNAERKQAKLLCHGGLDLQDIFYSQPGHDDTPAADRDVYQHTIAILDKYFLPKANPTYERYILRGLKQGKEESIDQFLVKLRKQAKKCDFGDREEEFLGDQVIEGCASNALRKRLLEKGKVSLAEIETLARTFETVSIHVDALNATKKPEDAQTVGRIAKNSRGNRVDRNKNDFQTQRSGNSASSVQNNKGDTSQKDNTKRRSKCYRCGSEEHFAKSADCPAREATCKKCNLKGHYAKYCRTKSQKSSAKSVKKIEEDDRVFCINEVKRLNTDKSNFVTCTMGGVPIELFVDSGAPMNFVSKQTWERLKDAGLKAKAIGKAESILVTQPRLRFQCCSKLQ